MKKGKAYLEWILNGFQVLDSIMFKPVICLTVNLMDLEPDKELSFLKMQKIKLLDQVIIIIKAQ